MRRFLLALGLSGTQALFGANAGRKSKPMPTAELPFEPFTPDEEVMDDAFRSEPLPKISAKPLSAAMPPAELPSLGDLGLYAQVVMKPKGFAGSFWAAEYPLPWLSIQQSLRFMDNKDQTMLFEDRASLNLGVEAHPFRSALFSPFFTLEAGGERFQKSEESDPLDVFRLGVYAGLEWRLNRYASLVGQWTSSYYPELKERVYLTDKEPRQRFDRAELALSLMWESKAIR